MMFNRSANIILLLFLFLNLFFSDHRLMAQSNLCDATCLSLHENLKITENVSGFTGDLDESDYWGGQIEVITDLDSDGINDLIVTTTRDDDGGNDVGAIWVLFMNNDGTVKTHQKISAIEGGFTGSLQANEHWGGSVSNLGDVNGDGITDIGVGQYDDDDGGSNLGSFWILFLNQDGTVLDHQKINQSEGGFSGVLSAGDQFGHSSSEIGDFNGDGIPDVAVGASNDDANGLNTGAIYLLYLNPNGTVQGYSKISASDGGFTGQLDDHDKFGRRIENLGDLDGDGVNDLAVASRFDDDGYQDVGAIWILLLNTDGTVKAHQKISATQGGITLPMSAGEYFGSFINVLPDINCDGIQDLLGGKTSSAIGSPGGFFILYLNTDGTLNGYRAYSDTDLVSDVDYSDNLGVSGAYVSIDPDIEGIELFLGANRDDEGETDQGAIYLVSLVDTCVTSTSSDSCTEPPNDLIGWWTGDGNLDDTENAFNGTNLNGVTFAAGMVDQAFKFDGFNDLIYIADNSIHDLVGDVTIDLWAKKMSNGGSQTLISKGAGYIPQDVPTVYMIRFVDDQLQFVFEPANTGSNQVLNGPIVVDTMWHFYAYIRSGSTHQLFMDNEMVASASFSAPPASTTGLPLTIGAQWHDPFNTGSVYDNFFEGLIDEIEIFSRALSLPELEGIFLAGPYGKCKDETDCLSQLEALYLFSGNGNDISGNSNHGSLQGEADWNGVLDIPDDNISAFQLPSATINGAEDFTFSFRILFNQFHTVPAPNGDPPFNMIIAGYGPNNAFGIGYRKPLNAIHLTFRATPYILQLPNVVHEDQWYCMSISRKDDIMKVYLGGDQVGEDLAVPDDPVSFSTNGLVLGQDHDCLSGCFDSNQSLAGQLDNFRIYRRALHEDEITAMCHITEVSMTICEGDEYHGYDVSGIYVDNFISEDGCDSIRLLNLDVYPNHNVFLEAVICLGEEFEGYFQTGTYEDAFLTEEGCDSIRVLSLTVEEPSEHLLAKTICRGASFAGYTETGVYIDSFSSTMPCDSIRILDLTVTGVFIPNAFTPNMDGMNDVFGISSENSEDISLSVYNRWGELIFESNEGMTHWDGTYKGKDQPSDAYAYIVEFLCEGVIRRLKGNVTLIR